MSYDDFYEEAPIDDIIYTKGLKYGVDDESVIDESHERHYDNINEYDDYYAMYYGSNPNAAATAATSAAKNMYFQ